MKKMFAPLIAILPLLYILMIGMFFLFSPSDSALFSVLGAYLLMTLLFTVCFCYSLDQYSPRKLAVYNILFSAGNVLLLLIEALFWIVKEAEIQQQAQNGATEGGLMLLVLIILYLPHWISYFMIRIAGIISCNRSLDSTCSKGTKILHNTLHFLPIADLVSSVFVLICVNSQKKA